MTVSDSFGPLNGFPSPLAAPPGVSSFEIPDLDFICESIPDAACEPSKPQEGAASAVLGHKVQQVVLLDPRLIRPGTVPNRAKAAFDQALFRHLQASITLAGGNVQPIAVRPAPADEAGTVYEIIYGERRHRACLLAGLPVRALVQESVNVGIDVDIDVDVNAAEDFLATFRENQGRADLAPWELGRQVAFALAHGYFSSQRKVAHEIGRDVGDVSRALQLAALAPEVIAAFASPLDLQFRHAKPLTDAFKKAPEAVLAEALRIRQEGQALAPGEVLARLVAAASEEGVGPSNTHALDEAIEVDGQCIARLVAGPGGLVQVRMALALDDRQRAQLAEQLQAFYRRCVVKAPKRTAAKEAAR